MKTKKITVNIPAYIQSVVDLEDKIRFAQSPAVVIPKMNYPTDKQNWSHASKYAFFRSVLP